MPATVWRGRLTFGMVSIPIRLYKAARRERIRFRRVYRPSGTSEAETAEGTKLVENDEPVIAEPDAESDQKLSEPALAETGTAANTVARVRNLSVAESNEEPVEKQNVLKGFEIEPNRYVALEPHEVAALRARTSTELDIVEFVRMEEIDPLFLDTSYFAAPDRGGEKPYALLFRTLTESGYAAIGSLAMHGREHATVIRSGRRGLILHTLFYANEVRAEEEHSADAGLVSRKELEIAKLLVEAMAGRFEPGKLKDVYEERLRALIDKRAAAGIAEYPEREETHRPAPVVDILDALRKSLAAARKPPQTEQRSKSAAHRNRDVKRARKSRS